MNDKNNSEYLINENEKQNEFIDGKIPILNLEPNEDIIIYFYFNEEAQNIVACFINKITKESNILNLDNFSVEKCRNCNLGLTINNCVFFNNKERIELYCKDCYQGKKSFIDVLCTKEETQYKNELVIDKLKDYLKKNEKLSNDICIQSMKNFIKFSNKVCKLIQFFNLNKIFNKRALFLQKFFDELSFYFNIVDDIQMENLYLFMKNFFIVMTIQNDDNSIIKIIDEHLETIKGFNITKIQSNILEKTFGKRKNRILFFEFLMNATEKKRKVIDNNFIYNIKIEFNDMKNDINNKNISWLKKKLDIMKLKSDIIKFIKSYNYSYNYISSKKVLERKFINEILYLLFKYQSQRFKKVAESIYVINSIQKELNNIKNYLNKFNDSIANKLKSKIENEINKFEQKKSQNLNSKKYKNYSKISNSNISLSKEEKELLNNYLITPFEESYTSIIASEDNSDDISSKKIQVILEFLFFIREKTIDIIHILDDTSAHFFEFLNQNSNERKRIDEDKDNNVINKNDITDDENEEEEDDDDDNGYFDIDELKKEFNFKFSKKYKKDNYKIIDNISVQLKENVEYISALNYIFDSNNYINEQYYEKELEYLYEKITLPKRCEKIMLIQKQPSLENSNWWPLLNNIKSAFYKLDILFKKDPLYSSIIGNFEKILKNKYSNIIPPKEIKFYEEYVDNFIDFKDLYIKKKQVEQNIELIISKNMILSKMKVIKKKYKFIKKELNKYLKSNKENYSKYYEEWKAKNKRFVIENYEIEDIINDLKCLIPEGEQINILGKEKKNFLLILYLFQSNYFLKDYL